MGLAVGLAFGGFNFAHWVFLPRTIPKIQDFRLGMKAILKIIKKSSVFQGGDMRDLLGFLFEVPSLISIKRHKK